MNKIELKNKIQEVIDNNELSEDVVKTLEEIRDIIKDDISKEDALNILLKWMSIFKDAINIYSVFKDFL